ncbi:hypothetical protein CONPUDRAFT_111340, partial [Coniophora puteana RWD-64-598 SS2]
MTPALIQKMDPAGRWGWFVNLAVERIERWCLTLEDNGSGDMVHLPPNDVVMVWHSYLLNSYKYAEDTTRISQLGRLVKYTEKMDAFLGSPDLLTTENPPPERIQWWEQQTRTPYAPADAIAELTHKYVQCPRCFAQVTVPFVTPQGTGYAQSKFSHKCERCGHEVDNASLGLAKLVWNIVESKSPDKYLARTVMTPTAIKDEGLATRIKDRVLAANPVRRVLDPGARLARHDAEYFAREILLNVNWSSQNLYTAMSPQVLPRMRTLISSAYTDDRVFSLDLVGAVLRQGSFIQKMHDLEWTTPGFFDYGEDYLVLEHCVARYHAFLGLMAESPELFFVPTLDIDLAWHTHQLMATTYQQNCRRYIKRYVDHDDKVEENSLANSFDDTCRVWQDKYHVPYMHCGCPLPGNTIGQKLKRLVNRK